MRQSKSGMSRPSHFFHKGFPEDPTSPKDLSKRMTSLPKYRFKAQQVEHSSQDNKKQNPYFLNHLMMNFGEQKSNWYYFFKAINQPFAESFDMFKETDKTGYSEKHFNNNEPKYLKYVTASNEKQKQNRVQINKLPPKKKIFRSLDIDQLPDSIPDNINLKMMRSNSEGGRSQYEERMHSKEIKLKIEIKLILRKQSRIPLLNSTSIYSISNQKSRAKRINTMPVKGSITNHNQNKGLEQLFAKNIQKKLLKGKTQINPHIKWYNLQEIKKEDESIVQENDFNQRTSLTNRIILTQFKPSKYEYSPVMNSKTHSQIFSSSKKKFLAVKNLLDHPKTKIYEPKEDLTRKQNTNKDRLHLMLNILLNKNQKKDDKNQIRTRVINNIYTKNEYFRAQKSRSDSRNSPSMILAQSQRTPNINQIKRLKHVFSQ